MPCRGRFARPDDARLATEMSVQSRAAGQHLVFVAGVKRVVAGVSFGWAGWRFSGVDGKYLGVAQAGVDIVAFIDAVELVVRQLGENCLPVTEPQLQFGLPPQVGPALDLDGE